MCSPYRTGIALTILGSLGTIGGGSMALVLGLRAAGNKETPQLAAILGLATGTAGYTAVLAVGIVMLVADDRREEEGDFSALAYIALGPAVALLAGLTSVVWVWSSASPASPSGQSTPCNALPSNTSLPDQQRERPTTGSHTTASRVDGNDEL